MRIAIIGAGKTGEYLVEKLRGNHSLLVIEQRRERVEAVRTRYPDIDMFEGDACEPALLEHAGVGSVDLLAAVTGDDEDNLVVSWIAKESIGVPLVFARVNHPRNAWLFTGDWGVDVAVSSAAIIHSLVEKEISLGQLVSALSLEAGGASVVEFTIPDGAACIGKSLAELDLPSCAHVMAVISQEEGVVIPNGATVLQQGDQVALLHDCADNGTAKGYFGVVTQSAKDEAPPA